MFLNRYRIYSYEKNKKSVVYDKRIDSNYFCFFCFIYHVNNVIIFNNTYVHSTLFREYI